MDTLDKLYEKGVSRRNFLVGAGAAGAVTALAGCGSNGTIAAPVMAATLTDTDILTFALNLEYLEAEFYLYAATGQGLSAADAGTGAGTTIVPSSTKLTNLTTAQTNILNEIAYDELTHVRFLRGALMSAAVARPAIDLTFFATLATAANFTPAVAGGFTPFADFNSFLVGAFIFEDVGVTAYNGAAPFFSNPGSNNALLVAAGGILAVEAYHAAYVRTILTANAINATAAAPYVYLNYAVSVQNLRAALSNKVGETLLTVPATATTGSTIVNADTTNALAFTRTTDQVHHIVYGSATVGVGKGGFFPNGTNFKFSVTTS